jgi:hypothetical protein
MPQPIHRSATYVERDPVLCTGASLKTSLSSLGAHPNDMRAKTQTCLARQDRAVLFQRRTPARSRQHEADGRKAESRSDAVYLLSPSSDGAFRLLKDVGLPERGTVRVHVVFIFDVAYQTGECGTQLSFGCHRSRSVTKLMEATGWWAPHKAKAPGAGNLTPLLRSTRVMAGRAFERTDP